MDANDRRNRASNEAADWWALLHSDAMSRSEREGFIDWLRDSQTNVAEILRLAQVHGALEQFREWADISTARVPGEGHGNVVPLSLASSPVTLRRTKGMASTNESRRFRHTALAASLAAIAVLAALLVPGFRGQSIATERGERRQVVLEDGSVVQVDPQTRLSVRYDESQRRIILSRGRAIFRVSRNPRRPFQIEVGGTTIRALGTAFGVDRRTADLVVVTVSEGAVAVSSPGLRPPPPSDREGHEPRRVSAHSRPSTRIEQPEGEIVLAANEQITVAGKRATPLAQAVRSVDSHRELAWAEGRLVFKNDTVASVIAEFNRYNRIQLAVTDATLAARPVTGVFGAENPEGFLAFIQNAAPVHIERHGEESIMISPRVSH